jgi:hypothetical protein
VWIDAKSGQISQTELWLDSAGANAHVVVKYAPQAPLDLWLPVSMDDWYELHIPSTGSSLPSAGVVAGSNANASAGSGETIEGHATYSHFAATHIDVR